MDFHSLSVLEYDKVKDILRERSASNLGYQACLELFPTLNPEAIQKSFDEIEEFKRLLPSVEPYVRQIEDPTVLLEKLDAAGAVLDPKEMNLILKTLEISGDVRNLVKMKEYPMISQITRKITPCPEVERAIENAISPDNEVLDRASPELKRLRRGLEKCRNDIKSGLNRIISSHKDAIQEEVVTVRDARYVINVKSSKQKRIGGIVHGTSASGMSLFLEPIEVVELNNSLMNLREEEAKEVKRILAALTRLIGQHLETLKRMVDALRELDFICAKTRFSLEYNCVAPSLNTRGYLYVKNGRHPLLRNAVPLTIEMGDDWTTVLLSGPNTGGKTVALKTVGLLVLLAQSGLEIPCEEGTSIAVFEKVFADIGDQQSIEENLSTFSSHMNQIVKILEESDDTSLVLLDELGVGTDPTQGEALGMAVLDELTRRRTRVMATSHYANLKIWVHSQEKMRNAAMLFDTETLQPTFQFKLGIPGASYGLEIARRIGMSENYLRMAKNYMDSSSLKIDELIGELEKLKLEAVQREEALGAQEVKLASLVEEYTAKLSEVRKEAKGIVRVAREEAISILDETRRLAEQLVREIREKDKDVIKKVRSTLEREMTRLQETPKPPPEVKPSDIVFIKSLQSSGTVTEVAGGLARVDMGKFRVTVPITDLEK